MRVHGTTHEVPREQSLGAWEQAFGDMVITQHDPRSAPTPRNDDQHQRRFLSLERQTPRWVTPPRCDNLTGQSNRAGEEFEMSFSGKFRMAVDTPLDHDEQIRSIHQRRVLPLEGARELSPAEPRRDGLAL